MGMLSRSLQKGGSLFALSGFTPNDGPVSLRHSHSARRLVTVAAILFSDCALAQHSALGSFDPLPIKYAPHGISALTASEHDTAAARRMDEDVLSHIGRPVVFSLAAEGEAGVRKVLQMLRDEFELTMALSGCTSLKEITRNHIVTPAEQNRITPSLEIDNTETFTIKDALESFTKVETLDDPDNKLSCEGCKDRVFVEKQIKLFEAPQVLSINFKRFKCRSISLKEGGSWRGGSRFWSHGVVQVDGRGRVARRRRARGGVLVLGFGEGRRVERVRFWLMSSVKEWRLSEC
ncbi:uncharacterized protein A4U43_C05F32200 [Asparagus officinalis]|uniref:FMN-dependent dehydrogenase domain-containing protein n=1 Tax=Asparagus officinalis TaxID=4686 RepID=A0A5P1F0G0_ASPOF|nr:uncharacterized protein A4U43_C05F32200 [Asparagus officinalis]